MRQRPHVEPLEIAQQTELGRKRRQLVVDDIEPPKLSQESDFLWQGGKLVVIQPEARDAFHLEQLGRHLHQIDVLKLIRTNM